MQIAGWVRDGKVDGKVVKVERDRVYRVAFFRKPKAWNVDTSEFAEVSAVVLKDLLAEVENEYVLIELLPLKTPVAEP